MTTSNSTEKRLLNFDIAKAICIILVVIGHYIPDNAPEWYVNNRLFIYSFYMPLFMFASGYIYIAFRKEESYAHFLMKKVKRLMVPYFTTSFLIVTIKLLTERNSYVENPVTVLSYIKILYSPEAGYFLWFIWALWWIFVIVPVLKTKRIRLVGLIIAIVMHCAPMTFTQVFCLEQVRQMMVFFMLGVVAYDHKDTYIRYAKNLALPIILLFVGCEYIYLCHNSIGGVFRGLIPYLGIATIMYISTGLSHRKTLVISKVLCMIAPSTYIIYLFHTTFEGFMKAVVHKIPMLANPTNDLCFIVGALAVILVGIVGPILLHKYILSRYFMTRFLFGLK